MSITDDDIREAIKYHKFKYGIFNRSVHEIMSSLQEYVNRKGDLSMPKLTDCLKCGTGGWLYNHHEDRHVRCPDCGGSGVLLVKEI